MRMHAARAQFPEATDFIALFSTTNTVSDFEDGPAEPSAGNAPIRIVPGWRSPTLTNCIRGLDKVIELSCVNKRKLAPVKRLFDRSVSQMSDCLALDAPRFLPEDAYCPEFLVKITEIERNKLRTGAGINLINFVTILLQRTTRH